VNNVSSKEGIVGYRKLYAKVAGVDIIAPNVHSSAEDKSNNMKGNFYEKLERVLHQFSK
jgi:hypothetical protein